MITEIFVEGFRLDISDDISSLLTFAIDDVKDFSSRQTTFSKTVVLPGTANNNAIFGNIFETGIRNDYNPLFDNIGFNFNPSKSAACIIFQDNMQTFKGTLRLIEIDITKKQIEYQAALNGDLTTLNVTLSSGYLTDLDFSEYDQLWNIANILASWDNPGGSGVYFPMIDYGTYSVDKHNWDFRTLRPALYVKEYIDKMFAATSGVYKVISFELDSNPTVFVDISGNGIQDMVIGDGVFTDKALTTPYPDGTYSITGTDFGFTVVTGIVTATTDPANTGSGTPMKYANPAGNFRYQCDLFNTPRFKKLIVPHNQKQLTKLTGSILSGSNSATQHIIDHTGGINNGNPSFGAVLGGLFTIVGGSQFTYTGADTISTTVNIHLAGYFNFKTVRPPSTTDFNCKITLRKNGVDVYNDLLPLDSDTGFDAFYMKDWSVSLNISTGDMFEVEYLMQGGPAGPADVYVQSATISVLSASTVKAPVDYNEMIQMQFAIPQNIRQIDFLVSIVKAFNLYVYEDQFDDRLIKITPFVDFYSSSSINSVDWTYKLNRDQPISIKPLSEVNSKIYNFNFAKDSDYWNDLYSKRYNQGYGSYRFDSEFEFATQENTLDLVFAPTPLIGYVGEDKIYPTIFKRTGPDTAPVEENVDSVIRIMQTKKSMGVTNWQIKNGVTILGTQSYYGYAGHLDDPDAPSNDLNFGALHELFFVLVSGDLSKTQFNVFWSAYMAEITDKDSKLVTAKFYLTARDIFNLDFSKFVYVDGTLFRLNKITDYNVSIPSDCAVELLKVINTSYKFAPPTPPDTFFILWDADSYLLSSGTDKIKYQ